MGGKRLMIGITAGEWEGIHHRPHHMMKRAARDGWTVLFIESPMTFLSPLKDREKLSHWKNSFAEIKEVEERLFVITLPPFYPFGNKYRFVNQLNQKRLMKRIRPFIEEGQFSAIDIYTFLPQTVDLLPLLEYERLVYDCVDDHISFSGMMNKEMMLQMEEELSNKAQVTYYTANHLQKMKESWANAAYLVPNGAEYEHFIQARQFETDLKYIPEDMKPYMKEEQTIIGIVGGIGDWVDLDIVYESAVKRSDYTFIVIGPVDTEVASHIKNQSNIIFLGARPYEELPKYLAFFDVCMIPFKINELTKSVNPIKMYEYLSTGKQVISTAIPEVVAYDKYVDIVNDENELIEKVEAYKTLSDTEKEEKEKLRQKVGKENSWDARWETIKEKMLEA